MSFELEAERKVPSDGIQSIDPQTAHSETVVITEFSEDDKAPSEDKDLKETVARQEKMIEQIWGQQATLTRVIATAILSPEQVALALQAEKGDKKTEGDTGNESGNTKGIVEERSESYCWRNRLGRVTF